MISLALCIGLLIGNFYAKRADYAQRQQEMAKSTSIFGKRLTNGKLDALMTLIQNNYYENVDMDSIVEDVIPEILAQLDPHSAYIPAKDLQMVNDDLEGSFYGIGVQFNIQNDTVMIVAVINGGPCEKLGILPEGFLRPQNTLCVREVQRDGHFAAHIRSWINSKQICLHNGEP